MERNEISANTLALQSVCVCVYEGGGGDEWKTGAPSILRESHLCVVFKTAVSLWVLPLKYS